MAQFFIGDIVRIVKRGKNYTAGIAWSPVMDEYIGMTGIISRLHNSSNYVVKLWNVGRDPFIYPPDALELETDPDRLDRIRRLYE